jgi:hypothetical protein
MPASAVDPPTVTSTASRIPIAAFPAVVSAIRLLAVHGSRALHLYERHGFRHERHHENGVDVVLVLMPDAATDV